MSAKCKDTLTADGKRFKQMLAELKDKEVRIGFQAGETYPDGTSVLNVAAWNELGTEHIPSRPFMRDSVDCNADKINSFLQSKKKKFSQGGTAEEFLKEIGVFQKALIQNQIANGTFEPNAAATIARKKSDKPLIDTGRMRQSVNFMIVRKGEYD